MTRFARARGSKSSNERLPEEATSWNQMRQQMKEKQQLTSQDETQNRITKNYVKLEVSNNQENEWAVFEEPTKSSDGKRKKDKHFTSMKPGNDTSELKNCPKKKDKLHKIAHDSDKVHKGDSIKKRSKKLKNVIAEVPLCNDVKDVTEEVNRKEKKQGKIKNLDENDCLSNETVEKEEVTSHDKKQKKRRKNNRKKGKNNEELQEEAIKKKNEFQQNQSKNYKRKFVDKKRKDKPFKRRKPEPSITMFINGKEIEVTKFDGFPVRKEDADRLKELRQKLIAKGIPKQDVSFTMKLERRKAEKALARERKKVCFHCRKSGHVLSECPELGDSNESGTGICFKCGSTEHTHFQCKVTRGQDFRFAECFVCKEQGHIARQCPDNPRGLYPKGGACKVCGDVTHLKKDCPDLIKEKEQQTITLGTLDDNSLEVLDEELKETRNQTPQQKFTKKKTVVKF